VSTYTASVRIEDGMLHTSRPLTAPDAVGRDVRLGGVRHVPARRARDVGVVSVELAVDTSDESETPIGDSVRGTSSQPLDPEPATAEIPVSGPVQVPA
jgi:hypothetical protein